MSLKPTNTLAELAEFLSMQYGLDVELEELTAGADFAARTFVARATGGKTYFVKVKSGHDHELPVAVARMLADAKVEAIVPPVTGHDQTPTPHMGEATVIVYAYVAGKDGFRRNMSLAQWAELGSALRQVHDLEIPEELSSRLRREDFAPTFRDALPGLYERERRTDDEPARRVAETLQREKGTIMRLLAAATELAAELKPIAREEVLCHTDLHAANILVADDGHIHVVDWDEPMMAGRERDLMYVGAGIGNIWNRADEEAAFYRGYGAYDVDRKLLAYYRSERIIVDVVLYGRELLLNEGGGGERLVSARRAVAIFDKGGAADQAIAALERVAWVGNST